MKNPLANVVKKEAIKQIVDRVMKPVYEHEGAFLTGATIVFNTASLAVVYRNSPRIHSIINNTRMFVKYSGCTEEERKDTYRQTLKDLVPLLTPIILLYAASVATPIINHKKNEAKIATLTAALSLAQTTITEYDKFSEEVRKEVGDEKYQEIKNEVTQQQVVASNSPIPQIAPGEVLCYIPDWDIFFSGTKERVDNVFERVNVVMHNNGADGKSYGRVSHRGNEIVTYGDILREFKIGKDRDIPVLADELIWEAGVTDYIQHWIGHGDINGVPYLSIEIPVTSRPKTA